MISFGVIDELLNCTGRQLDDVAPCSEIFPEELSGGSASLANSLPEIVLKRLLGVGKQFACTKNVDDPLLQSDIDAIA